MSPGVQAGRCGCGGRAHLATSLRSAEPEKWSRRGSNALPLRCHRSALPIELRPRESKQTTAPVTPHSYDQPVALSTPTEIGARAEAAVTSALVRAGKPVFLPIFGANTRIDLVYADDGGLVRVQCKTSRVVGDVLVFRTCSNTKNVPR